MIGTFTTFCYFNINFRLGDRFYLTAYFVTKYNIFLHHINSQRVNVTTNILSLLQWGQVDSFVLSEVFPAAVN